MLGVIKLLVIFPFLIYFLLTLISKKKKSIHLISGLYFLICYFLLLNYGNSMNMTFILYFIILLINVIITLYLMKKNYVKNTKFIRRFLKVSFATFIPIYILIILQGIILTAFN